MAPNLDEVLPSLVESARRLAGADLSFIALTEGPEQLRIVAAAGNRGGEILGLTLSTTRGTTAQAINSRRPFQSRGGRSPSRAARNPVLGRLLESAQIKVMLVVPIWHDDEIIGVFRVASRTDRDFTEHEIGMLELLAEQAAVAIDATRLYARELAARAEVEVLLAATESLGVQDEPDAVLRTLIEQAATRLEAERAIFAIVQDGRRVIPWHWQQGEWIEDGRAVSTRGINRKVWDGGQPYRSNDLGLDATSDPEVVAAFGTRSQLSVPLRSPSGEILGVVTLANSRRPEGFTDRDERLLVAISETGAAVLERATATAARLDAERAAARRKEELEALLAAADQLNSASGPQEVLLRVVGIAADLFDVRLASVATNEGDHALRRHFFADGVWRTEARPLSLETSIAGWVIRNGKPYRTDDVAHSPQVFSSSSGREQPQTVLAVPFLGREGAILGALQLFDRKNGEPFGDADERLAEGLAHYAATALERATLIDELRSREEYLRQQAITDPLTGLPNRGYFFDRLAQALERARQPGRGVAMLFVDLDGFKDVNDTLGHHAGDELLRTIGSRLLSLRRERDTVARVGGDEFALLLEDLDQPSAALAVAERLIGALRRPFPVDGDRQLAISASVGISFHEAGGAPVTAEEVAREADVALYQAKAAGKGQAVLFAPSLSTHAMDRLEMQTDLQAAIVRNELRLHYHPIIDLSADRVVGYEALLRWQHPRRGLLPPAAFMSLAEETGLIQPIGRWVLAEACRQANTWGNGHTDSESPRLSVNLSASEFAQTDLVEAIGAVLRATDLSPHMLTLEVTETAVVRNPESAIATLAALRRVGVSVAIDHFGIGYSSLSYLERLTVQTLKVDRSFISALERSVSAVAIVRATIAMAHALGIQVLAEGVETAEQLSVLRELGCDFGQGYHFAMPLPAEDLQPVRRKPEPGAN